MKVISLLMLFVLGSLGQTPDSAVRGMISRKQTDINRSYGLDVKDFGAVCDGKTDDTSAIQLAFDSIPSDAELRISGLCVISRMVYVASNKPGIHIEAVSLSPEVGLIAASGFSDAPMIRFYAGQLIVRNLYVNCDHRAVNGIVLTSALQSTFENDKVENCKGDGWVLDNQASPSAGLSSSVASGESDASFTIVDGRLPGYPLSGLTNNGGKYCGALWLDYGTPSEENFRFTINANKVTIQGKTKFSHGMGKSTVQCIGNNDDILLLNPQGFSNGGWGLDMVESPDNNGITVLHPNMQLNAKGGELWSGSVNEHIGGISQGNQGPALQLGDITGGGPNGTNGRVTFFSIIGPFQDLENKSSSDDAVVSVCDGHSEVTFKKPSELLFAPQGNCPDTPAGVTTLGTGHDTNASGFPRLSIKSVAGMTVIDPAAGMSLYDKAGAPISNSFGTGGTQAKGKGEGPSRPACIDASGAVFPGTNSEGRLTCP